MYPPPFGNNNGSVVRLTLMEGMLTGFALLCAKILFALNPKSNIAMNNIITCLDLDISIDYFTGGFSPIASSAIFASASALVASTNPSI